MNYIKTATKHAAPVIKERMVIIDEAEGRGKEPDIPVRDQEIPDMKNSIDT